MKLYRFEFTRISPFKSFIDNYTIFGAIAWGIRINEGEQALKNFLEEFQEKPPFLISSPLKHGFSQNKESKKEEVIYFPRPVLPGSILKGENCDEPTKVDLIKKYPRQKRFKKMSNLTWNVFKKILQGEIKNELQLYKELIGDGENPCPPKEKFSPIEQREVLAKASINRITSTTAGATLYNESAIFGGRFSVLFAFSEEGFNKWFQTVVDALETVELGGNKSVGWGRFLLNIYGKEAETLRGNKKILKDPFLDEDKDFYKTLSERMKFKGNQFITLGSTFAVCNGETLFDLETSFFNYKRVMSAVDLFYGLGDEKFIKAAPWKKAVVYLLPGSILKLSKSKNSKDSKDVKTEEDLPVIGCLKCVYPLKCEGEPRIYQYGFAFPLFLKEELKDETCERENSCE